MIPREAYGEGVVSAQSGVPGKQEREQDHRGREEAGLCGNDGSPGGPVTGECAEELWEEGRKVCEGRIVRGLACQEFGS